MHTEFCKIIKKLKAMGTINMHCYLTAFSVCGLARAAAADINACAVGSPSTTLC